MFNLVNALLVVWLQAAILLRIAVVVNSFNSALMPLCFKINLAETGGQRQTVRNSQQKQKTQENEDTQCMTVAADKEDQNAKTQHDVKDLQTITSTDDAVGLASVTTHNITQDDKRLSAPTEVT